MLPPWPLQDDHEVYKQRLDRSGQPLKPAQKHDVHATKKSEIPINDNHNSSECLTCYGAGDTPEQCCNTCDEVCVEPSHQFRPSSLEFLSSSCCPLPAPT